MNQHHLDVLMKEYHIHCDMIGRYLSPLYNLAPLAVTAFALLIASEKINAGAAGMAGCGAIAVMAFWLGFVHSNINNEGLRLVEIELKVSELLGDENSGFDWWTRLTGEGTRLWKGWMRLYIITILAAVVLLGVAIYYGITGLLQLGLPGWACCLVGAGICAFPVATCISVYKTEMETRQAKAMLRTKYVRAVGGAHAGERD